MMNFIGCLSRGSQKSDSESFLVPAQNFTNNVAALAKCQKSLLFFLILKCLPGKKNEAVW